MDAIKLAVIGAGSGGLVAATTANRLGADVTLIEGNKIGGECLHSGCVPSKAFIHAAKIYNDGQNAEKYGLPKMPFELEFFKVMNYVRGVVDDIYQHENPKIFRDMGIDVVEGSAKFVSPNEIDVSGQIIPFDKAVIATGSSPLILPIEGLNTIDYITNENVWDLKELPDSMLIIGGGPISIEMGQSFSRFGCKVTMIEIFDRVLPNEDESISMAVKELLISEGVDILTSSKVVKLEKSGKDINVSIESGGNTRVLSVKSVFLSIGRASNTGGLNLETANVNYTRRGIEVNTYLQTSSKNIYACGDVVGPFRFTHTAGYQGDITVKNAIKGNLIENDLSALPWVVFADPEIARVGITEKQAREENKNINILKVNADSIDRPKTESSTTGFIKIILDKNDKILGAHAIAPKAGEFIHEIALAKQNGLGINAIGRLIHAYPTFSEIVKKAATRYLRSKET